MTLPNGSTLRARIEEVATLLRALDGVNCAEASASAAPGEWSTKELLGHLIDSAHNNISRFVRVQIPEHRDADGVLRLAGYEQEGWVRVGGYADRDWPDLIDLWVAANRHLAFLADRFDATCADVPMSIGGAPPEPFASVVDYEDHLEHHLRDLLAMSLKPSAS